MMNESRIRHQLLCKSYQDGHLIEYIPFDSFFSNWPFSKQRKRDIKSRLMKEYASCFEDDVGLCIPLSLFSDIYRRFESDYGYPIKAKQMPLLLENKNKNDENKSKNDENKRESHDSARVSYYSIDESQLEWITNNAEKIARIYRIPNMDNADVKQEAYMRLLQCASDGMNEEDSNRKVRSQIQEMWRKATRRKSCYEEKPNECISDQNSDVVSQVESNEIVNLLRNHLSPAQFDVIHLTYWHRMSDEDIALHMNIRVKTVQKYRCHALKAIRKLNIDFFAE